MTLAKENLRFAELPTHPRFVDITGRGFNQLTVLGYAGSSKKRSWWLCECSCGEVTKAEAGSLKDGSCLSEWAELALSDSSRIAARLGYGFCNWCAVFQPLRASCIHK